MLVFFLSETLKQLCKEKGCEDCERNGDSDVKCFCRMGYVLASDGKTCLGRKVSNQSFRLIINIGIKMYVLAI
jgi:hypothetical protein